MPTLSLAGREHSGYADLRRAAGDVLQLLAAAPAPHDPNLDRALAALGYEIDARCGRCGEVLLLDLLGGIAARVASHDPLCGWCFFDIPHRERSSSLRAAQLAQLATMRADLVAAALHATLDRGAVQDYQLEEWLNTDTLAIAALALCKRPAAGDTAAIAALAAATGIAADRIAALLALADAPSGLTETNTDAGDAGEVPF